MSLTVLSFGVLAVALMALMAAAVKSHAKWQGPVIWERGQIGVHVGDLPVVTGALTALACLLYLWRDRGDQALTPGPSTTLAVGVLTAVVAAGTAFVNSERAASRQRRADILAAVRACRDDFYNMQLVLRYVNGHGRWPGPIDDYWRFMATDDTMRVVAGLQPTSEHGWRVIAGGRRRLDAMLAEWRVSPEAAPSTTTCGLWFEELEWARRNTATPNDPWRYRPHALNPVQSLVVHGERPGPRPPVPGLDRAKVSAAEWIGMLVLTSLIALGFTLAYARWGVVIGAGFGTFVSSWYLAIAKRTDT